MAEETFVDRLISDSYRIAEYARTNRAIDDAELWTAIKAVEQLPGDERKIQNDKVKALQDAFRKCTINVEPQTLFALRNDWNPFKNSWRNRGRIAFLVLISLASMAMVGQLTQIYNSGRLLSSDLIALQKSNSLERFGLLERELNEAQRRLSGEEDQEGQGDPARQGTIPAVADGTTGDASGEAALQAGDTRERYLLAREAAYSKQDELIKLDQQIRSLENRALAFQVAAKNPIVGMEIARSIGGKISDWFACQLNDPGAGKALAKAAESPRPTDGGNAGTPETGGAQPAVAVCPPGFGNVVFGMASAGGSGPGDGPPPAQGSPVASPGSPPTFGGYGHEPRSVVMRGTFCSHLDYLAPEGQTSAANADPARQYIAAIAYTIDNQFGVRVADIISQNCKIGLYYYSGSIPDMASLEAQVRDTNTLYSFIILPAAYGALGALMFYMRRILDPLLPDPTFLRTVHRVALGALAGVLLAWLWVGIFDSSEDFKAVGLGLFALAFVFGFSIEVFFDFLDSLVNAAKRQVSKFDDSASPATTANPATPTPAKQGS